MSTKLSRLRHAAFKRQHGLCFYCSVPLLTSLRTPGLSPTSGSPTRVLRLLQCTAEHCIPRCEGGKDHRDNVVAACLFCNQTRHKAKIALSSERFAAHVRKRLSAGRWHPPGLVHAARVLQTCAFAA
jgi:5-methylcytosine-specific restriction endonuclease McrA